MASIAAKKSRCNLFCTAFILTFVMIGCVKEDDDLHGQNGPVTPMHVLHFEGVGRDLASDNDLLAVATKHSGVSLLDTSNPARPVEIGSIKLPLVYKAMLQGTSFFAIDEQQGLSSADLKNLDSLQLTRTLSAVEMNGYVSDALWIDSTIVLASDAIGLSTYSVQSDMQLIGSGIEIEESPAGGATILAKNASRMVAASRNGYLSSYIWTDEDRFELDAWLPTTHPISGLACNEEVCFAAALGDGLYVYRMAVGANIEFIQKVEVDKAIDQILLDEDRLYVSYLGASDHNGWFMFELNDGQDPELKMSQSSSAMITEFMRVGEYLYVLLENGELEVYDRESLL